MRLTVVLWIVQVLLALLYLWAGGAKFVMTAAEMQQGPITLPLPLIYFIGACEVLGALGLILPSLLRIKPGLTPLAAAGLAIIMCGAVYFTFTGGMAGFGVFTIVVLLLNVFVAYGRWKLVPIAARQ